MTDLKTIILKYYPKAFHDDKQWVSPDGDGGFNFIDIRPMEEIVRLKNTYSHLA